MKKTLFSIMALAMAMVSCTNNELPEAEPGYGYINVNVSNDPVVETRASQTVGANDNWNISATQDGKQYSGITLGINAVPKGTYVITAASHASEDAALSANNGWGAAYYEGTSGEVTVTAGQPAYAVVNCGTAKNARLKVQFRLISNFTEYSLTAERGLVFNSDNAASALAYYAATEEVDYTLNYKYNGAPKKITGKIIMKGAATENIISIASNDNGTISVTVNYDDTFGTGNSENLEFDAATGDEVKK